jgi:hypothetical protein
MNQLFSRRLLVRLQLWLNSKILRIRRLLLFQKSGNVSVSGDLIVSGNLTISGNTTTLNTETLTVEDNVILLNSSVTDAPSANAGIEIERGSSTNVELRWNETDDKWQFSNDGTTYVNIASTTDVSNHEADTTNIHGIANTANLATLTDLSTHEADTTNIHGIADTSALVTLTGTQTLTNKTLTSPTITGVSPVITLAGDLTGSVTLTNLGNGTLTATVAANSVALGTDTTGNYMSDVTAGTGVSVVHTPGEGSSATIAIGQSVATNAEVLFSGIKTTSVIEPLTILATAATGTVAIDAANGTTYYTSNASANFVPNLRWNSSTTLDSKLAVGEMTTLSWMVTNGGTAYYPTSVQVNGTTSGVTTRWQGGTAPSSGNTNSVDMYTFTVVKTAAATFSVFAAQTRFA